MKFPSLPTTTSSPSFKSPSALLWAAYLMLPALALTTTTFAAAAVSAEEEEGGGATCGLWMAPSFLTTESNPKFGLIAGRRYEIMDDLPNGELAIPFVDFMDEAVPNRFQEPLNFNREILDYLESYMWTSDFAGSSKWEGNYSTAVWVPGNGMLANFHTGVSNVDWNHGSTLFAARSLDGVAEPGVNHVARGLISPYHNMTMRATKVIVPGMELFASFGDVWESSRGGGSSASNDDDIFQEKVNKRHYNLADQVLESVSNFIDEYGDQMSEEVRDDVLDFLLHKVLNANHVGKDASTIRSLIPGSANKIKFVADEYGGSTFAYRNKDMIRSDAWLNKHGLCVDNVRSGVSTIPQAGRGLFSTVRVEKDDVILPVPVVPMANKFLMNMYDIDYDDEQDHLVYDRDNPDARRNKQLMYNYCFGHPESSLLLFPTGPMISFVNHGPAPTDGDNEEEEAGDVPRANAVLTWSDHEFLYNDYGLHDFSVNDVNSHNNPIMTMTLVALRDIQPGEEILVDYGREWSEEWAEYEKNWNDSKGTGDWPLRAEDVRGRYADKPYPVDAAGGSDDAPYPEGVATACFISYEDVDDGTIRYADNGAGIYKYVGPEPTLKGMDEGEFTGTSLVVCDLVDRNPDDDFLYNYTVLTRLQNDDDDPPVVQVINVPHEAIMLVDQPYKSDQHAVPNAFRHYIGIDDDKWPQMWRDIRFV